MAKLENYLKFCKSELEAIRLWAQDEHKEMELLEIIPQLASSHYNSVARKLDFCKTWSPMVPDMHMLKELNDETASLFNYLFQCVIHETEPNENMMTKIRDTVPKIKIPTMFFRPALKWLADRGIQFIDSKPEDLV